MDARTLSNGTLWLSPPTVRDIDDITACCQEPSVGQWTTMPVPYIRADAEKFVYDMVTPGWAARSPTWALRLAADAPVIGMIGLGPIDSRREDAAAEIGFWLSRAVRGRGLMTQAVHLACEAGFHRDFLGLARIEWRAIVGNHASAAVARRAGFHYEGLLRGGCLQRGARRDSWIASRLHTDPAAPATDWPANV
ncbi:GNAT family N-acetyltransferase [Nocardia sp. NBC_01327]|uniref:GNAT family N-acetyltransferase n=1 Tax=Nocardia sp. NBC_01327 TaxID=2903593 RepID=UPI002E1410C3|nr:GNAT family N-acetyltransferase [Nocardia sp. NBC_01327]